MMDMDTAPQSVQDRQRNMNTLKKCRGKKTDAEMTGRNDVRKWEEACLCR